jgi:hypothetical protein
VGAARERVLLLEGRAAVADAAASVSVTSVVLFLDLDNNRETGFLRHSVLKLNQPNGTEVYVELSLSGGLFTSAPQLYSGCAPEAGNACRTLLQSLVATDCASTTDGVEFRVAQSVLAGLRGAAVGDLSVSARLAVTDWSTGKTTPESAPVFPLDSLPLYTTLGGALPACGDAPTRSAVLFSQDEQRLFFNERAYAQLMAMQ